MLTCSSVIGNSNSLTWAPANTIQFKYLSFLHANSFSAINNTSDGSSYAYVYDITRCPNNAVRNIPCFGVQNGAQFIVQVVGTVTNNSIVKFGSLNWKYTSNGRGSTTGSAPSLDTTYIFTYYATA